MRRLITICLLLFASIACAASLQWDASVVDETHGAPDGYRVHRGTAPGVYDWQTDVELSLQWPIPDYLYGEYYWAASAYNTAGASGYSNEVYWTRALPQYAGATDLRVSKSQVGVSAVATDDFNRSNENPLGNSTWSTPASLYALQIVSQVVQTTNGAGWNDAYWGAITSAAQYSQCKVYSQSYAGPTVWNTSSGGFYIAAVLTADRVRLYKQNPGGSLDTLTTWDATYSSGAVCKIEINSDASVITVTYNGVELGSYDDSSSPLSTGSPGMSAFAGTGANIFDDWEGDAVGGGTSAVPVFMRHYRARRQ